MMKLKLLISYIDKRNYTIKKKIIPKIPNHDLDIMNYFILFMYKKSVICFLIGRIKIFLAVFHLPIKVNESINKAS